MWGSKAIPGGGGFGRKSLGKKTGMFSLHGGDQQTSTGVKTGGGGHCQEPFWGKALRKMIDGKIRQSESDSIPFAAFVT